jgi:hypothetical protein
MIPGIMRNIACGAMPSLLLVARLAPAQDTASAVVLRSKTTSAAPPTAVISGAATRFELESTKDDNAAAVQTSLALARLVVVLGLSAKPDENKSNTRLANATGLATGTTASLGLSGVKWLGARSPRLAPGDVFIQWCVHQREGGKINTNYDCNNPSLASLPDSLKGQVDELFAFTGRPVIWLVEGSAGPQDFDFVTVTATLDTVTHWQSSARAGAGFFWGQAFLSGAVAYKNRYKAADDADLCTPIVAGGLALTCTATKRAAPAHKYGVAWSVDARTLIRGAIGIALTEGYDGTTAAYSTQIPVYLAPNDKSSLIGGIVPGWDSKTHKWSVGVFVGAAFGLAIPKP